MSSHIVLTTPTIHWGHHAWPDWRLFAPVAVAAAIALAPVPAGLPQHAWYDFAIFAGAVTGLILEPLPGAVVGFIAVTVVAVLSRWVLFGPADLAKPGFDSAGAAIKWALSGFSNSSVWLIFGAFMFALGYEETGLGRRIALLMMKTMGRKTLALGYAVVATETLLAPFIPSNTARTGGTIYPVIRNLPPLYESRPNDPVPGMAVRTLALLLVTTLGIMGVLTPYGTGPSPIFFGSGYLPAKDYWRLGAFFGMLYFVLFVAIGVPYLFYVVG